MCAPHLKSTDSLHFQEVRILMRTLIATQYTLVR